MKKTQSSESKIIQAIKEFEGGRLAEDICRELGIGRTTFYQWRQQYSGMEVLEFRRLKELEEENRKLKNMFANLSLVYEALNDAVAKKL